MERIVALLISVTLLVPGGAFAATLTIECVYPTFSDKDGRHEVTAPFEQTFIIDAQKETAYVVGSQGSGKVDQIAGKNGLSFIEVTSDGNVMTTTIDSKGTSVHSRNTWLNGIPMSSQHYGTCIFK